MWDVVNMEIVTFQKGIVSSSLVWYSLGVACSLGPLSPHPFGISTFDSYRTLKFMYWSLYLFIFLGFEETVSWCPVTGKRFS